jgi:soluble lytic murein transglycosylase-like protein
LLEAAAGRHGLDAAILKALAWQESGWQQDVVSPTGAVGIMQVVPGTARYVTEVLGAGSLDLHTAADNVEIGAVYLRHLLDAMGSEERAIAAYYTGPGAVGKHLDRRQRHYVTNVLSLAKRF